MPAKEPMRIERRHSFPVDEARQRVQAMTDYWRNRYGINIDWSGNTGRSKGRVKGISFDAQIVVAEKLILCEADVGFLAERLGARAYIERKLDDYLDPQKPVASLPRR